MSKREYSLEKSSGTITSSDLALGFSKLYRHVNYYTIDSRILYKCIVKVHKNTLTYNECVTKFKNGCFPLNGILPPSTDIKIAPNGDQFMMLDMIQASRFILMCSMGLQAHWDDIDSAIFVLIDRSSNKHENEMEFLVVLMFINSLNKTYEEALKEKEEGLIPEVRTEKYIEVAFGKELEEKGFNVKYQVRCEYGVADIVTSDTIYEIKAELNLGSLRQAIAQAISYKICINPHAKICIVGRKPKNAKVNLELARLLGAEVIIWDR